MNARILVVDDHPVVRSGLRRDLERHSGWSVIGEAANSGQALESARTLKPDLIIMDEHLGEHSGLALSQQLLSELPFIKILIFSADANRALVDKALQIGVMGYVLKASESEEVVRAVEMALEGRLYLCPEVASSVIDDYKKLLVSKENAKPQLTEREFAVLRMIAEGNANKEIADRLSISVKAVEKTRSRIMSKLGYHSTAELVRYAVRQGLIAS